MEKKRLSQLISLLLASTAVQGLWTTHAFAASDLMLNASVDSVSINGPLVGTPTTALTVNTDVLITTLTNNGTIQDQSNNNSFSNANIAQINGNLGTFINNGTISSLNQNLNGSILEVGASGVISQFFNNGTIAFAPDNYNFGGMDNGAIDNAGYISTLTNGTEGKIVGLRGISNQGRIDYLNNDGDITSSTTLMGGPMGQNGAIYNTGTIGELHNTGSLQTGANTLMDGAGIFNWGTITRLVNDNKIIGSVFGITNHHAIDYLENNGVISAQVYGIYSNSSDGNAIAQIDNNGEIRGGYTGIYLSSYSTANPATLITNSGLLTGDQYALYVYSDTSSEVPSSADVTLTNSGVVAGNIYSRSPAALKINGGTGAVGTLTGINDEMGLITAERADVVFGTGSLLLNDHVSTSGTVLNDAATLQVNNSVTLSGDYHQKAAATLISGISDLATQNLDLLSDSGYGRLNVSGNAVVDAGSSVSLLRTGSSYQFAEGQRYVVINAQGSDTQYNADKLYYKAIGYRGQVNGAVYEDGANKALVLTVGPEDKDPVVTEPVPVDPTPTQPTQPTTPTQPTPVEPKPTQPTMPAQPTPVEPTPTLPTTPGKPTPVDPTPTQPAEPTQPVKNGATTPNATTALAGLSHYSGISSPQLLELYNASLAIDGTAAANRAGEQLSTSQNINTSTAAGVATTTAQAVVGAHMDAVRNPQASGASGVATGDDYSANWILWGQPFGGYARQESSREVSGYSAKFGGLILGADRDLGDAWRVGAALNYSNTSVHGKDNLSGNTSTADNYGVIAYAGYTGEPWYLNLSAGVNRQNYSSVRRADFTGFSGAAQGKFNGQSVTLQTEFGYPVTLPAEVVVTPLASLTYGYQHVDGYTESGGNGMALDVGSTHAQSVVSDIGMRVEKTFATGLGSLTPFAQLSWIHQYDNRQVSSHATYAADTIGETGFITKGAAPVKDMAGVALGTTLYNANDLTLDARYDLQASDSYQAHTFSLRLRKTF